MNLSEKILYCRKKALMSQEALAERIGVSRQAVSKWETGESAPEIGKLLQLAQAFGVTTDWLLAEDDPEPRPEPALEAEPASPPQPVLPEKAHTWVDDVPGMIGNLLRKYGWIFGVRLAVSGALFLALGILASGLSHSFFHGVNDSVFFGNPSSIQLYDESGNLISDPGAYFGYDVYEALGVSSSRVYSGFESIQSTGGTIFGLFSGFMMLLGGVMLVAGVILAIKLRKLNRT